MAASTAAEPRRRPGWAQTCAVATSPASPRRTHREHCAWHGAAIPHAGKGDLEGHGKASEQCPGTVTTGESPARVPADQGEHRESSSGELGSSKSWDAQAAGPSVLSGD